MRRGRRARSGTLTVRACNASDTLQESFKGDDVQSRRKTVNARLRQPAHDFGLTMQWDFAVADESRRLAFVRIVLAPRLPLFGRAAKALAESR
jgi:hypothetical protein